MRANASPQRLEDGSRRFIQDLPKGGAASHLANAARHLLVPLLLIIAWEAAARMAWLPLNVLPSPLSILHAGVRLHDSGALGEAVRISLTRLLAGFLLGAAVGVSLGLLCASRDHLHDLFDGTLQTLRGIPFLALAPLFALWFGLDDASKIALVTFATVFPLYLNTVAGVGGVDPKLIEAARSVGLRGTSLAREVLLPGALPSIFSGLRVALAWALAALAASELADAATGVGALVAQAREFVQTDVIFLCVAIYALFGIGADAVLRLIEWPLFGWRHPRNRT